MLVTRRTQERRHPEPEARRPAWVGAEALANVWARVRASVLTNVLATAAIAWALVGGAVPAWGAAPVVPACKGALEPSAPGACQGVQDVGCCDALGRALWCAGGDLYCLDCEAGFASCGWNPLGYYGCGQEAGSADPSGQAPRACGACPVQCQDGAAACSPDCAGACGSCPDGAFCLEEGGCYTPQCAGVQCGLDPNGYSCGVCPPGSVCLEALGVCGVLTDGCAPRPEPGCDGCACEACVCATYPGCCTDQWDLFCAGACEVECGADCSGCPPDATCDDVACGSFCGLDCGACPAGEVCLDNACCAPTCDGKACGGDGCGGTCGACEGTDQCANGQCVPCVPACGGKACGDDGCGGSCGVCLDGELCMADGTCGVGACAGLCGGGAPAGCANQCQCYCDEECFQYGDCCEGVCQACGDLAGCCVPACEGKACGDDGCGGSCGACAAGTVCDDAGQCAACAPACEGKACGDDGCGGSCGACEGTDHCVNGQCAACAPSCAGKACGDDGCGGSCGACEGTDQCVDGQCDGCQGLTYEGCCDVDGDAVAITWCQDGALQAQQCPDGSCGWNLQNGYYDCGFDGADPEGQFPLACPWCAPGCDGKTCGDDGCGGSCGVCPEGTACGDTGQCEACAPSCDGKACGDDGCGGSCGSCPSELECDEGAPGGAACVSCAPKCQGKACGDDGCGGSCGGCEPGVPCLASGLCDPCEGLTMAGCCALGVNHWCEQGVVKTAPCGDSGCGWSPEGGYYLCGAKGLDPSGDNPIQCPWCLAACVGRECGDDGCGGSCGVCADGQVCDEAGACVAACAPECGGKECGPDGCGGACGACPPGQGCHEGSCQSPGEGGAELGPEEAPEAPLEGPLDAQGVAEAEDELGAGEDALDAAPSVDPGVQVIPGGTGAGGCSCRAAGGGGRGGAEALGLAALVLLWLGAWSRWSREDKCRRRRGLG